VHLHKHFSKIENPNDEEKSFITELKEELKNFHVASVNRTHLLDAGFDPTDVSDEKMEDLAAEMSKRYCDEIFWQQMDDIADQELDIPYLDESLFVLVEYPEDSSYFENEEIGYPCFNTEDNGARYVPIVEYIRHFEKSPEANTIFKPLRWPESQNYFGETSIDALCEPIEDEQGMNDFGSHGIWVPLSMLRDEEPVSKYAVILEEVRDKFAAEIAEADTNPDKWFEVFVADETGSTHSEDSGDTFD
jgi:hypothetical protein